MPRSPVTPAYAFWAVFVFCSLFAVVYVAWIPWEASFPAYGGPICFRLPLASLAKPMKPDLRLTGAAFGFAFVPFLLVVVPSAKSSSNWFFLAFFSIHFLWSVVSILLGTARLWVNPRCDAKPWRLLASGLLALVMGAVALATGLWALQVGESPAGHPVGPLILVPVPASERAALEALLTEHATTAG